MGLAATNVIDEVLGSMNLQGDTVRVHEFTAELPMRFYVPDTNTYWFSALSVQPTANPLFSWISGGTGESRCFQATLPTGTTWIRSVNRSFALLGDVNPPWAQAYVSPELETIRTNRHMPGLSAMAIKEGRIMALGAAGVRRQGQSTPLLTTDLINLGSCTKWMTATIAGRLVDRNSIAWTTRVRDVFTNYQTFNVAFHDATLDQLLAHRAGVQQETTFEARHWSQFMGQAGTLAQLRRWVSETVLKDGPEVTPGDYLYANQGYAVAATMLEIASGKDWETLIREEVFTPLRMRNATLGEVFDNVLPPKAPVGHYLSAGSTVSAPVTAVDSATHFHLQAALGAGGYVACTLQDWAKFLHVQATSDISDYLTPATATRLQQPFTGSEGYGRGVFAFNRSWATPGQALNHSGQIFGHDTVFWMAPARDLIVVVFANCQAADDSAVLAMDDAASLLVSRFSSVTASGPMLETPTCLLPRFVDGKFSFDFLSLPGVRYLVQTSPDLITWNTVNGATGQVAASLQSSYTDLTPALQKLYRISVAP
jgi:CubicO group peptidase (beta-lactamase class C family)